MMDFQEVIYYENVKEKKNGEVNSPESPEITEVTENFTKFLTKVKDTLLNYV